VAVQPARVTVVDMPLISSRPCRPIRCRQQNPEPRADGGDHRRGGDNTSHQFLSPREIKWPPNFDGLSVPIKFAFSVSPERLGLCAQIRRAEKLPLRLALR
jgi:hypothetical protein